MLAVTTWLYGKLLLDPLLSRISPRLCLYAGPTGWSMMISLVSWSSSLYVGDTRISYDVYTPYIHPRTFWEILHSTLPFIDGHFDLLSYG